MAGTKPASDYLAEVNKALKAFVEAVAAEAGLEVIATNEPKNVAVWAFNTLFRYRPQQWGDSPRLF